MKLNYIASIVGAGLLTAACHSGPKLPTDKALAHLAKTSSGKEFVDIQRMAEHFRPDSSANYSDAIHYWDSIANAGAVKKAKEDGKCFYNDSLCGKASARKVFKMPTIEDVKKYMGMNAIDLKKEAQKEASQYYSGQEMYEMQLKEPCSSYLVKGRGTTDNHKTFFFDRAGSISNQRKVYNDAIEDAKSGPWYEIFYK